MEMLQRRQWKDKICFIYFESNTVTQKCVKILQKDLKNAATFYHLVIDTDFGNGKYQKWKKMCLVKHHYITISTYGHWPKTDN